MLTIETFTIISFVFENHYNIRLGMEPHYVKDWNI